MSVYLALQLTGSAARYVTIATGRLLPCLFTLAPLTRCLLGSVLWERLFSVTWTLRSPAASR